MLLRKYEPKNILESLEKIPTGKGIALRRWEQNLTAGDGITEVIAIAIATHARIKTGFSIDTRRAGTLSTGALKSFLRNSIWSENEDLLPETQ